MPAEILEHRPSGPGGSGIHREGSGGGGSSDGEGLLGDTTRFGLLAFLGTVSMLFVGFTSAYIVRRTGEDWRPLRAPGIVWVNTAVLLLSSGALQAARGRLKGWDLEGLRRLIGATFALGLLFVTGQLWAWRQLAAQGIFLASNPHSSFFYLLTGLHMAHVLGGLVWFLTVLSRVRRMAFTPGEDGLALFATYWHFLAGLWVYLAFLLFVL